MLTFSLKVPPDLRALRTIQAFIEESAAIYGFKNKKIFSLIAEEAFLHIFTRLKKEESDSLITITTESDEKYFIISFKDKGMPIGSEKELSYMEKMELAIIRANCEKLSWINHGKKGNELKILIKKPQKNITEYEIPFEISRKNEISTKNIIIERLNPEDAYQVSKLIYITYGYTYPNEDLYYPETIKKLNETGKLVSIVAKDKSNNKLVGHYALEIYGNPYVAELGQAVVDINYRGHGIFIKLRKKLEKTAKENGFKGIFSQPVTSHLKTQKTNEKFGSRVCGISFGLTPKEFDFRKMDIKPLSQRETCFFYYKPMIIEERKISPPKKHAGIISEIYKNIGLPFKITDGKDMKKTSLMDSNFDYNWGYGTINVKIIGEDFTEKFSVAFRELRYTTKAEVIFLNIPLNGTSLDRIVDFIENKGFFFIGVAPYLIEGKDALRFEYLNTLIDTERIKIYSNFGEKIFNYTVKEMKKVL